VVLLQCSPQPSNGIVEEAQVFSAAGDRLGVLPSPRGLPEAATLPPIYDPATGTARASSASAADQTKDPRCAGVDPLR